MWPLSSGRGGGKALVAEPLKKITFLRLPKCSLTMVIKVYCKMADDICVLSNFERNREKKKPDDTSHVQM